jgi:hypothetical protein
MRKLQFIALDEIASKALDLIEIEDVTCKLTIAPSELVSSYVSEYQQIIIISKLDFEIAQTLFVALKNAIKPILIYPEKEQMTPEIKLLLLSNIALFPVKNSSLMRIALSEYIEALQVILQESDKEDDIDIDDAEYNMIFAPSKFNTIIIDSAHSIKTAAFKSINHSTEVIRKADTVLFTCELDPDSSIIEFSEALQIIEDRLNRDTLMFIQMKSDISIQKQAKIYLIYSVPVNMADIIQKEIDEQSTYLFKLATISDNFNDGYIDSDIANMLAKHNAIDLHDLAEFYKIFYEAKNAMLVLMNDLQDKNLNDKEELISKAVFQNNIDSDYLETLVDIYHLDRDKILGIVEEMSTESDI